MIGRFRLVTLLIPAVLTIAAISVVLAIAPTLPDPVAIHWNAAGAPDGFAPLWAVIVITVLTGFALPAGMGLASVPGLKAGDQGGTYRFFGALAVGLSVLMTVLSAWSLVVQRGLIDAGLAPTLTPAVLASSLLAVVAGLAGWFIQPASPALPKRAQPAEPLALGVQEEAVWVRTTSVPVLALGILAIGTVALLLGTIAAWLLPTDPVLPWSLTGTLVILLVAVSVTSAFRVRANRHGLTVTSLVGLPRLRVPIEEIASVGVVQVNPAGEFGGVGLRVAPGRFGVVVRRGEAISVTRLTGRQFVVTVDDAETAVAVLSAYLQRAEAGR